jgi:hypothetical protein
MACATYLSGAKATRKGLIFWLNRDPIGEMGFEVTRYHRQYPFEKGRWLGPNLYWYSDNNPAGNLDPLGLWTFQVGVTWSINLGWVNFFISTGISGDTQGNIDGYWTGGGGAALAAGVSAGVTVQVSNAKCNNDLGGPFGYASVGGGWGAYGSGDAFWGNSDDGPVVGYGGTFGVGAGGGGAAGLSWTEIVPISDTGTTPIPDMEP